MTSSILNFSENQPSFRQRQLLKFLLLPAAGGAVIASTLLSRPVFWQEGLYLDEAPTPDSPDRSEAAIRIGSQPRARRTPSRQTIRLDRRGDRGPEGFTAPAREIGTAGGAGAAAPEAERPPTLKTNQGFQPANRQPPAVPASPPMAVSGASPLSGPAAEEPSQPSDSPSESLRQSLTALLLPPPPSRPAAAPQPLTATVPGVSERPAPRPPGPAPSTVGPLPEAAPTPEVAPTPRAAPLPDTDIPLVTAEPTVEPMAPPPALMAPAEAPPPPAPPAPATPASPPVARIPEQIQVDQFQVTGSTAFNPEDLAAIALSSILEAEVDDLCAVRGPAAYPDELLLTPSQLIRASSAIEQCYIQNDYINSGAFIAESELAEAEDGTVEITVIEGQLEAIDIEVTQAGIFGLNPNYVASRLRSALGAPFNLAELVEAVELLELDPLIDSISTELVPGTQTGNSILDVTVEQNDGFNFTFFSDNDRSPSVGSIRRGVNLSQANLLGLGDRLSLGYNFTGGSDEFNVGYTVPINPKNGTLGFSFTTTDSEVIEEPFTILDIQSESRTYEAFYRQPIILTPNQEFALSARLSRRETQSEFLEGILGSSIPFPGTGADAEGRTRTTVLRLGQEWVSRSAQQVIALLSEFSFGLDGFGSTIQPIPPDGRFFLWRGQGQWVRSLGPDSLFILRGNAQLADRPLLPNEQFSFGGQSAGRGYRLNTLLRDNGWFLSSEFRVPLLRIPESDVLVRVAPFFDVGGGWNEGELPDTQFLTGTGLGLIVDAGDNFSARLDWGVPLSDFDSTGSNLQDSGIYFSIEFSL